MNTLINRKRFQHYKELKDNPVHQRVQTTFMDQLHGSEIVAVTHGRV